MHFLYRIGAVLLVCLVLSASLLWTESGRADGEKRPAGEALGVRPDFPKPDPDGKVRISEAEWRSRLTPERYRILREAGTERACSGAYWQIHDKPGVYVCGACGLPLFSASSKFDSGTGWPSFTKPLAPGRIIDRADNSHGMQRVENICARCDSHLGHVFTDGPEPSGLRYCMNSAALLFLTEKEALAKETEAPGISR